MFTEQQEKFLKRVEDLFLRFGIKSLTMDDVARELGISKKTLYQFVENKDDLVKKVMERHILEDCRIADEIRGSSNDALDEILKLMRYNAQDMGKIKTNAIYELQRYYPEAWQTIQSYTWDFMFKAVMANLESGIRDGLFRADIKPDIIARIHLNTVLHLFDERLFPSPPYALETLFNEYINHYLHGILSEKGFQKLKAKMS